MRGSNYIHGNPSDSVDLRMSGINNSFPFHLESLALQEVQEHLADTERRFLETGILIFWSGSAITACKH